MIFMGLQKHAFHQRQSTAKLKRNRAKIQKARRERDGFEVE
jgi:hypothetical protein